MLSGKIYHNPSVDFLVKKVLEKKEAIESASKTLVVYTGQYTGRSPQDRFIVDTKKVHNKINWGKINVPISPEHYKKLETKTKNYINNLPEHFIVDSYVGADKKYQLSVRVISETAYQALFVTYLFRRPKTIDKFKPDLTIYASPSTKADPKTDGTNSDAFIILNFDKKTILIGTTKYAGEIKKSVFSYMNYLLPQKNVFPMHCSANVEKNTKQTALFFGLSGTGKTTLSADPDRYLIGDDEHGWSKNGIFNFEGGCYAKCIRIKKESEPQIWSAIHRPGTLTENIVVNKDGSFDFEDDSFTENTRAGYPLEFIQNAVKNGLGKHPKDVIFLTADASGVLPPVARLTPNQAAFHFLSGYTSKLAGTERGIKEPKPTFSAFFGAPFMPLKPMIYLSLLQKYLKRYRTKVFLVNTGWMAGPYGTGYRIPIKETRAIVSAILSGKLNDVPCHQDRIFNLFIPKEVPGVDKNILEPQNLWKNPEEYITHAKKLAILFTENLNKFAGIHEEIINSGPKI
ncbi:MAG: phosphoenolpyruvate carboxykinase (ATP) [Patescibacteria group bacterium]|jgi:phosphoenolpyruvate carboxykinase (ATP)